jgi:hypothetical protein
VPKYSVRFFPYSSPFFFFFFKNVWMQNIIQYKRYIFLPVIESTCDHFYILHPAWRGEGRAICWAYRILYSPCKQKLTWHYTCSGCLQRRFHSSAFTTRPWKEAAAYICLKSFSWTIYSLFRLIGVILEATPFFQLVSCKTLLDIITLIGTVVGGGRRYNDISVSDISLSWFAV